MVLASMVARAWAGPAPRGLVAVQVAAAARQPARAAHPAAQELEARAEQVKAELAKGQAGWAQEVRAGLRQ